jgi:hypothetical protein
VETKTDGSVNIGEDGQPSKDNKHGTIKINPALCYFISRGLIIALR